MHLCKSISVKLENEPLDSHPEAQGTYLLSSMEGNQKPMWISDSCAIWYNVYQRKWVLGLLKNLGTNQGYDFEARSNQDNLLMPCEENFWRFHNMRYKEWREPSGYGLRYHLNSVNIQCTGNVIFLEYVYKDLAFLSKVQTCGNLHCTL